MTVTATIQYKLIDTIPSEIDDGVLYISREYATAVHKCCCGCGHEVVTPLGPTDWRININGDAVSVFPSVGNWSLECKSHYWIDRGRILWAEQWSEAQITFARKLDHIAKQAQYGEVDADRRPTVNAKSGFWQRLWRWLRGR